MYLNDICSYILDIYNIVNHGGTNERFVSSRKIQDHT